MTADPQQHPHGRSRWRRRVISSAALVLLGWLLVTLLRQGDLLILPGVALVVAAWLALVVGWLASWIVADLADRVAPAVGRLARAAWTGLHGEPEAQQLADLGLRVRRRLSRLASAGALIRRRLVPTRSGLGVTLPAVAVIAAGIALLRLHAAIGHADAAVPGIDVRYAELAVRLRIDEIARLMSALSGIGATRSVVIVTVLLAGGAVAAGHRRGAAMLVATGVTSSLIVTVLKTVVARPRPPIGALAETSFSWPSGHAAGGLALAGGICLLVWEADLRSRRWIAAVVLPVGLLIGYSRAYLTMHWLSDVAAGWLVASTAVAAVLAIANATATRHDPQAARAWPLAGAAAAAGLVALLGGVGGFDRALPQPPPVVITQLDQVDPIIPSLAADPFSRTLTGAPMEPVSVVIVADEATVRAAVAAAGWTIADEPTVPRLLHTYAAGIRGAQDLTAPVTPTFLHDRMQDLAIQQQADGQGVRARHHARLWHLPVARPDGCATWAATASYDDRVEWNWHTLLPNHHIDPNVDAERDHVVDTLTATGTLRVATRSPLVAPTLGTNAAGDPFFTDGHAVVLEQPGPCQAQTPDPPAR